MVARARNQAQFDIQSPKIVEAILNLDAAVLGLIELENNYEDSFANPAGEPSIETLVKKLNDEAGTNVYDWIRAPQELLTSEGLGGGGLGPDAIAVGIIYQPQREPPQSEKWRRLTLMPCSPARTPKRTGGLDLMERLWSRNDMSEDEAMKLALEAQEDARHKTNR